MLKAEKDEYCNTSCKVHSIGEFNLYGSLLINFIICAQRTKMNLSQEEVSKWLEHYKLEKYDEKFKFHKFCNEELLSLNDSDLRNIGVTKIADRKRLLIAVRHLNQNIYKSDAAVKESKKKIQKLMQEQDTLRYNCSVLEKQFNDSENDYDQQLQKNKSLMDELNNIERTFKRKLCDQDNDSKIRMLLMNQQQKEMEEHYYQRESLTKETYELQAYLQHLTARAADLQAYINQI